MNQADKGNPVSEFRFKQFSVTQDNCGMKVSTDGVLLGAWAEPKQAKNSLDIGTGTGLLSLMLAQRFQHLSLTAIEYDPAAYACATRNVRVSPFAAQIQLRQGDITQWHTCTRFEHIVCNPPYFTSGQTARDAKRATARHAHTLTHEALLHVLAARLTPSGCADLILPVTEGERLIADATQYGLHLHRQVYVHPTPSKPASRLLFTLSPTTHPLISDTLVLRDDHNHFTPAFAALTRDFYLKLP
jgi:tRNA1Val (adenine37-N6)-methyltransferase